MTPGRNNDLTDIAGLTVGSAEDRAAQTGVTVIRFAEAVAASVDVRGGGPATRETDALAPDGSVGIAHAITLSGGSVFGLAAADAVAVALSSEGVGFRPVPDTPPVPLVPAACLYDLANGGSKNWSEPPYRQLARDALAKAGQGVALGSVGAGFGAVAGTWRGGLGSASLDLGNGIVVAALIAVNSIGSPVCGDSLWAAPFEIGEEFGGLPVSNIKGVQPVPRDAKSVAQPGRATSIGVVATNATLDRLSLRRVAIMAQDGLVRAVRPSHAPLDGDTIFAVSTAATPPPENALTLIGAAAADCITRATARGVWLAEQADGFPPSVRASLSRAGSV